MKFVDTHAHIYSEEFEQDVDQIIEECLSSGVEKIFMPNIDEDSIQKMLALESKYPEVCHPMIGIHPCYVKSDYPQQLERVEKLLGERNWTAVGEIGIDLYWDKSLKKEQELALAMQIDMAKEHNLPIVLHCRDSFEETYEIVKSKQDGNLEGIFHCFTGSVEDARKIEDLGFYIGIGGVSTFKNGGLDKVLPHVGLDRIVLETDAPYLSPTPYRGKRNKPSYIPLIAQRIADLKEVRLEEVAKVTTDNSLKIFKNF
ncbi:TatD family hydrolase [Aureibacter tunicatorum]|uniref:TatD DNase family protein n=1 Tax=Aureibacter tunicatorum TaxID=866807 RepID=A0AAE4BSI2_9BACT|nr:TatD family hydrolase [Aureibacter tunicatorum]MDR6241269.1 TatD DNase family protein [Aureibacter tunicatorum]BDD03529.1 TatD family hydrolase [Aureibacter tunicatorum]